MAVGKTSLRKKYISDYFSDEYLITVGFDVSIKTFTYEDSQIDLQIWDLGGQYTFSNVRPLYYRGSAGAIIVYDVTNPESYNNVKFWLEELFQSIKNKNISLMLVANKVDLREDSPQDNKYITKDDGEKLAKEIQLYVKQYNADIPVMFFETSAKSGQNVATAFDSFIKQIYQKNKPFF